MISFDPKYRKQEELGDYRAMPEPDLITDLRLNIGNSCVEYKEYSEQPSNCALQLNLLPLTPAAQKAKAAVSAGLPLDSKAHLQFLWQSLHPGSYTVSVDRECSEPGEKVSSLSDHPVSVIGIDVNQIPAASTESEDHDSPASSTSSPLVFDGIQIANSNYSKGERETEKAEEFDDRTYEISSKGASEEEGCSNPPRKKLCLLKEQSTLLEESFKEHSMLNLQQKQALAKQLCLRPRQVEVWFQNRRARTKLKQTEVDCELLKRCCENLTEENRRLKKELQELRAMKISSPCVISPDFYMAALSPATTTLTMCPFCERLSTVGNTSHGFSSSRISRFTQFSSAAC